MIRYLILLMTLISISQATYAHKASDSYLHLDSSGETVSINWEIAIRDLENEIVLDENLDGEITWGELRNNRQAIENYADSHLKLHSDGRSCKKSASNLMVNHHSDGVYVVLSFDTDCFSSKQASIDYALFFDIDSQHRGLLKYTTANYESSFVFSPDNRTHVVDPVKTNVWKTVTGFVTEGVWHIWIGYDHILFLLSLLLPAVLIRQQNSWFGAKEFKPVIFDVCKIVTAFTIAHSITLSFVVVSGISPPVNITEIVIALSVTLAALNNLYPILSKKRWLVAMGFGLIHGFGFANVLSELTLTGQSLFLSLLGFNLGVELGQLAIILVFVPIIYFVRNKWLYQTVIVKYGSVLIASVGLLWVVERSA